MPDPADMPANHGVDPQIDPAWEVEIADVEIHIEALDRSVERLATAIDDTSLNIKCIEMAARLRSLAYIIDGLVL